MDSQLLDACAVLLGPQARRAGQALLAQLTVAMVRSAFRRLALRTHPDAAAGSRSGALFIEASQAYEVLMAFLLARSPAAAARSRERRPRPASTRPSARPTGARSTGDRTAGARDSGRRPRESREIFYRGPLPRRPLRLAEFLYYSGCISWQTLIAALVWQRTGRPKFLEIARQLRFVEARDMARVLQSRALHEHTGEAASRLRLLTVEDVARILRIQRARQRPIGRYFVENTPMTSDELQGLLHELHRHNARCRLDAEKARRRNRVVNEEATA